MTIKSPGAVIDSVDLRNVNVEVRADNVTIKNSLFNATGFHTIYQTGSATGLVVEYNTFDGQKANNSHSDYIYSDKGASTIRNNEFFNRLPTRSTPSAASSRRTTSMAPAIRRARMPTRSRSTSATRRSSSARTTSTSARRPTP